MESNAPALFPTVMSSSSERDLDELFDEVNTISGVDHFDLIVPRRADFSRLKIASTAFDRMAGLIADPDCYQKICDHLIQVTDKYDVKIPALATYFPGLTAKNNDDRRVAIAAVVNAMRIAAKLSRQTRRKDGSPRMEIPVVELVCGSIVDPGAGDETRSRDVWGREHKLDLLCRSLVQCVNEIKRLPEFQMDGSFGLALEMEPGETYVLNGATAMRSLQDRIEGSRTVRDIKPAQQESLAQHVGFNIDIAHMRIAKIKASSLTEFEHRIVHAHISDHPRMHTHDQYVGSWTNAGLERGGYREYLDVLLARSRDYQPQSKGLPFTRAVAVELEGCNRIFWIHDSLLRLKHAIAMAQNRFEPKPATT